MTNDYTDGNLSTPRANSKEIEHNVNTNKSEASAAKNYLDRLHESKSSNPDTEGLGTINGEGDKEVPEFPATRHELEQLAKYWEMERFDILYCWFCFQSPGSSDFRWLAYLGRRLSRLRQVLGLETMRIAYEDAIACFRERFKITDETWRVFTQGTVEESDAWREKQNLRH